MKLGLQRTIIRRKRHPGGKHEVPGADAPDARTYTPNGVCPDTSPGLENGLRDRRDSSGRRAGQPPASTRGTESARASSQLRTRRATRRSSSGARFSPATGEWLTAASCWWAVRSPGTTTRPTSLPPTLRLPPRAVSCLWTTTGPERHYAFDWIILELLSGGGCRSTHRGYIVSSLLSVPPPLMFSDRLTGSNGEVCHDKR